MKPHEPLTGILTPDPPQWWDDQSTASALRALAVRLHSMGLSLRETATVLDTFGITRSHQVVFQWVHRIAEKVPDPPTAKPSRVAVDFVEQLGEAINDTVSMLRLIGMLSQQYWN